jgi:hypothetical protein
MIALFCLFLALFASPLKSKSRLEAENAALRHQLIILRRKVRGRVRLTNSDRLFFIQLYRWFPSVLKGHHDCPPRDPRAMAPSRLPPVLALEIPLPWRSAANRRGPARVANELANFRRCLWPATARSGFPAPIGSEPSAVPAARDRNSPIGAHQRRAGRAGRSYGRSRLSNVSRSPGTN